SSNALRRQVLQRVLLGLVETEARELAVANREEVRTVGRHIHAAVAPAKATRADHQHLVPELEDLLFLEDDLLEDPVHLLEEPSNAVVSAGGRRIQEAPGPVELDVGSTQLLERLHVTALEGTEGATGGLQVRRTHAVHYPAYRCQGWDRSTSPTGSTRSTSVASRVTHPTTRSRGRNSSAAPRKSSIRRRETSSGEEPASGRRCAPTSTRSGVD